ncbi:MAG TPA: hypothetical protein VGA12_01365 [Burkholderiales bacterium]
MDLSLSDPLMAALIGASATVLAALVQLRLSWRNELKERERGQPITKKARRGPVIVVFALMIAAAVGGFALSEYFVSLRNGDRDTLRAELQSRLSEISASAARLEQARLHEREKVEAGVLRAVAARGGEEGAAASALVGPCKAAGGATPGTGSSCSEQGAVRVAVCARVPASATVREVLLYTRLEDSQQSWEESRVQAGQDAGMAKFVEKFFERPDGDAAKQVCQGFVNWNGEKARVARILVKYSP